MFSLLAPMGLPILCGIVWGIIKPAGLDAEISRRVLANVVFNLLLPALVLLELWHTELGLGTLKISAFVVGFILAGLAVVWLVAKFWRMESGRLGAAMLATAFPNVTYLGLPVLEQTFGPWTRPLVIQVDLFGALPMMLVASAWIGRHYGREASIHHAPLWRTLITNPPLLSAGFAVLMNIYGIPLPGWLGAMLGKFSAAVVPLMLIALGMGLNWRSLHLRNAPSAALVLACRLALIPWVSIYLGKSLGFAGDRLAALVMEAGMPSMMLGVVFCDRYRLDTAFYSMIVLLSTGLGMFSLVALQRHLG